MVIPSVSKLQESVIQYSDRTIIRAQRALSCSPFRLQLLIAMRGGSVPLPEIAGDNGINQNYTIRTLTEAKVETELMWLIQVGLLRREVDGQGITDSFRLTPLGKQIITQWEQQLGTIPAKSGLDCILNACSRWLRLPDN